MKISQKALMKIVMNDIFNSVQHSEKLHELLNDLSFLPERMKLENLKGLMLIYMIKLNTLFM